MPMGYSSCNCIVIKEDLLKELGYGDVYEKLEDLKSLDEDGIILDEVQCGIAGDTPANEDWNENVKAFYAYMHEVSKAIEEKLKVIPSLIYHSADDDGDAYDDINGFTFYFDDSQIYQVKPELGDIEEHIERMQFVVFG